MVNGAVSLPAVVGSTVPVAVFAFPVGVLSVHWIGCPWRLRASNGVLVISLKMGESLQFGRTEERERLYHPRFAVKRSAIVVC